MYAATVIKKRKPLAGRHGGACGNHWLGSMRSGDAIQVRQCTTLSSVLSLPKQMFEFAVFSLGGA